MTDAFTRQLDVYLEGEIGHNGNVLATTFVVRLNKLLNLLHRMERLNTGSASRKTEYEVVNADKYNPTVLGLKPVPKVKDYNPAVVFDWTFEQFENVASGNPVDERVDIAVLNALHEVAIPPKDGAFKKFWLQYHDRKVVMDEGFSLRARSAALEKQREESPRRWHTGVSLGQVTGDLKAVLDEAGEQEFVIHPPVGPDRIVCKFPEDKRSLMNSFLFNTVVVEGRLHYGDQSPHPMFVEMTNIRAKVASPTHLLDLRGLFKGLDRPATWAQVPDG